MGRRKRAHSPTGAGRDSIPRDEAPPVDVPGNIYLENLINRCYTGGATEEYMRRSADATLDKILGDPRSIGQFTGCTMGRFSHIVDRFWEEMAAGESRLFFWEDLRGMFDEETGLKLGHLPLILLMEPWGGPVQDGMAVIYNIDRRTASRCLEYGRPVLERILNTPERSAADLMDALHRGAYDEMERMAPDLTLSITFEDASYDPQDVINGPYGIPPDEPCNTLTVFARDRTVDSWTVPRDCSSRTDAFRLYLDREGEYLKELTRPLPDGRRWTIKHPAGLVGIKELFPGADVVPLYGSPQAGPRAPKAGKRPRTLRPRKDGRRAASLGYIQGLFPGVHVVPPD